MAFEGALVGRPTQGAVVLNGSLPAREFVGFRGIPCRDGNLGPGTRPDWSGHGSYFLSMGRTRTRPETSRVRGRFPFNLWVTHGVPDYGMFLDLAQSNTGYGPA